MDLEFFACPICSSSQLTHEWWPQFPELIIACWRCGTYRTTADDFPYIEACKFKHLLSGVLRANSDAKEHVHGISESEKWKDRVVTEKTIDRILSLAPTTVGERATALLRAAEKRSNYPGEWIEFRGYSDCSLAYCSNDTELTFYAETLADAGLLNIGPTTDGGMQVKITAAGWSRIEELRRTNINSAQGFVAMWFDPSVQEAFDKGIFVGIDKAGYRPVRVDKEEFNDGIFDKIIASIKQCRFVVGDLTGERPNAYLEIGYALGMDLPVILTCRKDAKTHFDLAHRNTIFWSNPAELATRIEDRIIATIGRGPLYKGDV